MSGHYVATIVRLVLRHPLPSALVGFALVVLAVASATRLEVADDARALVAEGDPELARQLEALSDFTTVDNLLLHLDSQGHPDELEAAAVALTDSLQRSGMFTDVRWQADATRQLELLSTLMPRRFLLDPRPPAALLAPEVLEGLLANAREEVLSPPGILAKTFVLRDPLGSLRTSLEGLSNAPGLSKLDATSGRFLSQDGQSLLVLTVPKGNPFGGGDAARTMAAVARGRTAVARVAPHVIVRAIGAHRFANDAEGIVKRDVYVSAASSLAVILAIFFAFFRRIRLVVLALPPLAFGAAMAFGLAGALGRPVHGIVLAFAFSSLGLAIDYTVHLVAAAASDGDDIRAALFGAAQKVGRSLNLAVMTTMAGLFSLTFSQVPALEQMGVLALGAVGGAYLGTLLWVPLVLPLLVRGAPLPPLGEGPWSWAARLGARRPLAVVATIAALGTWLGSLALATRLDGDLRNLDTHTAQATADEDAFTRAFGDPASAGLALVEAQSVGAALREAAGIRDRLRELGVSRILDLTLVAPPEKLARARRAAWCSLQPSAAERLAATGARAGFRPDAFAAFEADWTRLCGPEFEALLDPAPAIAAFENLLGRPLVRTRADGSARMAVAFEADEVTITRTRRELEKLGIAVVHRASLNARLVDVVAADMPRLGVVSLALVILLLAVAFRSAGRALAALAPCGLAILTTLGVFALTQTPIDIMNLAVFPLVFGAGVDYGLVIVDADPRDRHTLRERAFSVTVAALTTLAGFGTLAAARYYALATIGRAVLIGIGSAAVFALLLTPALRSLTIGRSNRRPPTTAGP